jgi:GxxExxY protein
MIEEGDKLVDKELTKRVLGGFFAVYNALGFGFLENVYAAALTMELERRGILVQREVPVRVYYLGQPVALYRADMLAERRLLLEVKTTNRLMEVDRKQVLNYLRCTDLTLALLLNFGPTPEFQRLISTRKPVVSSTRSEPLPPVTV